MKKLAAACVFLIAAHAGSAVAADLETTPSERPETGWTFTVAPYLWMAGIEGNVAQFGAPPSMSTLRL